MFQLSETCAQAGCWNARPTVFQARFGDNQQRSVVMIIAQDLLAVGFKPLLDLVRNVRPAAGIRFHFGERRRPGPEDDFPAPEGKDAIDAWLNNEAWS